MEETVTQSPAAAVAGHTPTPWKYDAERREIVWADAPELEYDKVCRMLGEEHSSANAAFIVEACNSVERLERENKALLEIVQRYHYWTGGLLQDLPKKRDWLEPETEDNLRQLQIDSAPLIKPAALAQGGAK